MKEVKNLLTVLTAVISFCVLSVEDAPQFVKLASYDDSLLDAYTRLAAWEHTFDRTCSVSNMTLGAWHVLGPFDPQGKVFQQVISFRGKFDFTKPFKVGKDAYAWRVAPELKDAHPHDMRGFRGDAPGSAYILARDTFCASNIRSDGKKFFDCSLEEGSEGHYYPGRNTISHGFNVFPERDSNPVRLYRPRGDAQFCITLRPHPITGHARFYFHMYDIDPNAPTGTANQRRQRRADFRRRAEAAFSSPLERYRINWEKEAKLWYNNGGCLNFVSGYEAEGVTNRRLRAMAKLREDFPNLAPPELKDFEMLHMLRDVAQLSLAISNAQLAVEDHIKTFGADYPQGKKYQTRLTDLAADVKNLRAALLKNDRTVIPTTIVQTCAIEAERCAILRDTPLITRNKLLVAKGSVAFSTNWGGKNHIGEELVLFDPNATTNACTTIVKRRISDFDLHWDADHILYSDGHDIHETQISDPSKTRVVTKSDREVNHYDVCYLPSGKILSVCNACWQTVPCIGDWNVGNLHLMEADGSGERRITFDQDHSWSPVVTEDGNVMFLRWEYADIPHYFSRLVMRMKPDGTGQMEYYGSNSYWPNSIFWPRPIPGQPSRFVGIVSGHHGVSRAGMLYVFDTRKGRFEADGVVCRIPNKDFVTEPIIQDELVSKTWPRFAAPYPLADVNGNRGAGKYFLVSRQKNSFSGWELCLVDVFDNVTPILEVEYTPNGRRNNWMSARPVQVRPIPRVIPDTIDTNRTDALLYLVDIYKGGGLKGFPKGSIKKLRLATYNYRHFGNGGTYTCAYEGGWDVKRVLGTVPVDEDGSAFFRVPANTPVFVQPLDAEGKAVALMRSWYNAMPGEVGSCVGCHEEQNSIPPVTIAKAVKRAPSEIEPYRTPSRGFSFEAEIQPILNRRCVGCHDARAEAERNIPDFRDKRIRPDEQDKLPQKVHFLFWLDRKLPHLKAEAPFYSPSYMRLQKYVRRAGLEADYHLLPPAEFEADTSILVRMLKKGHHGVTLRPDEWSAIYTWIDMNVPYCGRWLDSPCPPSKSNIDHRVKYQKLYSNIDDHDEDPIPVPAIEPFEEPAKLPTPVVAAKLPFRVESKGEIERQFLTLPSGKKLAYRIIPAGEGMIGRIDGFADEMPRAVKISKPFGLSELEISNEIYAEFDPQHDSRYIEWRGKDRTSRGVPVNLPNLPVVRVTWNEAKAFCSWLSEKTGKRCSLPTEEEWEWAARAGSDAPFTTGDKPHPRAINLAGGETFYWNYGRAEKGYSDGNFFSAPVNWGKANAWGLFNMNGNVAEWTDSDYDHQDRKVIRGGSWNDTAKYATNASRWRSEKYKPVYDTGFRIKVE